MTFHVYLKLKYQCIFIDAEITESNVNETHYI